MRKLLAILLLFGAAASADVVLWTQEGKRDTTLWEFNTNDGKNIKIGSFPGQIIDVLEKGGRLHTFTDRAMFANGWSAEYPFECGTFQHTGKWYQSSTACRPGQRDGFLFVRQTRQDIYARFANPEDAHGFEDYEISHIYWYLAGDTFKAIDTNVTRISGDGPFLLEQMDSEFARSLDIDYYSLARKQNEVGRGVWYDGLPAYSGWIALGDDGVFGAEAAITTDGENIRINAKLRREGGSEKTVQLFARGFLKTESLLTRGEGRGELQRHGFPAVGFGVTRGPASVQVPQRYILIEAAGGLYYVMAPVTHGFNPQIINRLYILRPGESGFAKIAPPMPKTAGEQRLLIGEISFGREHILVEAGGKRYLHNLSGKLVQTFDNASRIAFGPGS